MLFYVTFKRLWYLFEYALYHSKKKSEGGPVHFFIITELACSDFFGAII